MFFHYITEGDTMQVEKIEHAITVAEVREHMRNNFRFRYFVTCISSTETEIVAVTSNGWVYTKDGKSIFCGKDKSVIARREG